MILIDNHVSNEMETLCITTVKRIIRETYNNSAQYSHGNKPAAYCIDDNYCNDAQAEALAREVLGFEKFLDGKLLVPLPPIS